MESSTVAARFLTVKSRRGTPFLASTKTPPLRYAKSADLWALGYAEIAKLTSAGPSGLLAAPGHPSGRTIYVESMG